jgi:hypothetical protein
MNEKNEKNKKDEQYNPNELNELVAEYNNLDLKRFFINLVDCEGSDEFDGAYVITDSLNKNEPIVKVCLNKAACYRQVNKANAKYREVFYSTGSIL